MNNGYIKLHRKIRDNWIYEPNRPRTRYEAWEDLLFDASYKDREIVVNGKPLTVKVGQVYSSIRFLAQRWKWTIGKVQRFLKAIQGSNMIRLKNDTGTNLITICNYETYQVGEKQTDTETIQQRYTNRYKDKESKEIKNIYNDQFLEFWDVNPRKISKKKASDKYIKILANTDHQLIMDSLNAHLKSWNGTAAEFIPHPTTWLNGERWNDEIQKPGEKVEVTKKHKYLCPDCDREKVIEGDVKFDDLLCECGSMYNTEYEYRQRKLQENPPEQKKREISQEEKEFQNIFKNTLNKISVTEQNREIIERLNE